MPIDRSVSTGLLLAALVATTAANASRQTLEQFSETITNELAAENPEAAERFREADGARNAGDLARAEELYREVRELEPGFFHAARRLCGVVLRQGSLDGAGART